ncbi:MAG: Smr/MutS family protein [Desulfococcaceae bacterium]|nr:Smr/MutS family protein [Desulfococcaceae bacterium]
MKEKKKHAEKSMHKPFEMLGNMLKKRNIRLPEHSPASALQRIPESCASVRSSKDEDRIFTEAMSDVVPLSWNNCIIRNQGPLRAERDAPADDGRRDTLARLRSLIRSGEGFIVSDTPEYMEGRGCSVSPLILRRLRRGDFSVQDYVDLHGLNVFEAREVLDNFLKRSLSSGKRLVLIVHGRGLSSPLMPVLKTKVCQWLSAGLWRKWVMAFCSARSCDGGAGASYVLLRQRPLSKGQRRRKKSGFYS